MRNFSNSRRLGYWLSLVVVLLSVSLLASACGRKTKPAVNRPRPKNENQQQSPWRVFKGSLKDLMAKKQALKCEWQAKTKESGQAKGTIYVYGKKFRQDMTTTMTTGQEAGKKITNYSLSDGQWLYTWSSIQPNTGIKMDLTKAQNQPPAQATTTNPKTGKKTPSVPDFDKKIEYHCEKWQPQADKFMPPADINFIDPTAMMENMFKASQSQSGSGHNFPVPPAGNNMPNANSIQQRACAACKQAPTLEMQQQCLQQAGCTQ